jgi:hypothetical protein
MEPEQDPQFDMVREYHVWGADDRGERRCSFDTFEEAEEVRLNGHSELPGWKPNRRRRVRFAIAVYRTLPDMQGGTVRYRIGTLDDIAPCDAVQAMDEELQALSASMLEVFE